MCLPLLAVGAAASIGSSVLGGIGKYQAGQAVSDAESYNQAIMENDIRQLAQQGEEQKSAAGLNSAQQLAAGQTSFAAGNVNVLTGSASDWEEDIDLALQSDRFNIDASTGRKTKRLRQEQQLSRNRAASAEKAGKFGVASSLLSGFGSVAGGFAA